MLETFGRWDVSSNLGAVTRSEIFTHKIFRLYIYNNNKNHAQQVENYKFVGTKNATSRLTRERKG